MRNLQTIQYPIFDYFRKVKVSLLLHKETSEIEEKYFVGYYAFLTERWYLRCHKYRRRNLHVYPNIYFRESNLLFRGDSMIRFNHKRNKQTKQDRYFDEINEKLNNYC